MISVMNSVNTSINEVGKCLDSQLWHACAGGMVQLPPLNSKVFYFPQGHAEHAASGNVNFGDFSRIPPYILCQVSKVTFMADPDTDEVYAKIGLLPLRNLNDFDSDDNGILGFDQNNQNQENPTSFSKTLTQSDANNGGGFSVPRYCAETIFPKLDYTADPPVQNILAKDVHGQIWKFRHIYRGTPRRHLLTTGWSNFVNHKKLIAGDSIVFLKSDNNDLCVGIRRAKRGINENNDKFFRNPIEKFNGESVFESVKLAANGQPFEVFYYPRASTPEFCVKASTVMAAMRIQWCPGMRFKMAFETEDSSRISWFMGTISSIHINDQQLSPNSPWRLLQVSWDEPDLLQHVKRVNPWSVELVSSIHLSPFSPPRKKLRILQPPDLPPLTTANHHHPTSIQGARQNNSQFGQNNHLKSFPIEIANPLTRFKSTSQTTKETDEHISCLLTMGNTFKMNDDDNDEKDKSKNKKKPIFVLFGQPILTEQQLSESWSGDVAAAPNVSDGSVVLQNGPVESSSDEAGPWSKKSKQQKSTRMTS
ncbi:auxin response factor 16 [Lactuca sativa]|uniref:Auxin response factor n=1 Tax=Lactuca sativa TaxID=4236 RepID=A0A9R1WVE6_LACSA|nr:auxin response factor 16 [Lactuca sativa]XP_042753951.1 auxin response factor 16 [Lactuca sativa]KAJ0188809.1 hypothetical protein LSAT_V11C900484650 [Lactuca sativa]